MASYVDHWWMRRSNPTPLPLTNPDDIGRIVASEIPDAIARAVAAGAVLPLTYLGSGAYGNVFCDAENRAFKVSRAGTHYWGISEEAAWLRAANQIPGVREHVAKYYGYQDGVLIRECVTQREFRTQNQNKIWEIHQRIRMLMRPAGWGAPEFKYESYAVGRRGPVLFDASSAVRVGTNLARLVTDVIARRVDYPFPLSDLAYDVRMEVPGTIPPELGKRLEKRIEQEQDRRRTESGTIRT